MAAGQAAVLVSGRRQSRVDSVMQRLDGESFHCRIGSDSRDLKRRSCCASLTENQYLRRNSSSSTSSRSKIGHWR
jgi:hypothetical protein